MQALLDALRAPRSSASRFLSFYDKFPFIYFETNLQSKRRKTSRWFSCFVAEETFQAPRADHFSSNFGLFAANHDKFFAFHLPQKRVFATSNFSFFFLLKHSNNNCTYHFHLSTWTCSWWVKIVWDECTTRTMFFSDASKLCESWRKWLYRRVLWRPK